MILWGLALAASAQSTPELGALYGLEIDGAPVGTRELGVHDEGSGAGRVRIVTSWTEITLGVGKRQSAWRQRLTASLREAGPASFQSVTEQDGRTVEVQARLSDGVWHVSTTDAAGTREQAVPGRAVDVSTIDLFDPDSSRRLAQYDVVRVLSDVTGAVETGAVVALGPSDVRVAGETLWCEGYEWQSPEGPWRFFYASNGFLVRWEAPLAAVPSLPATGKRLAATMIGSAPLGEDEFPVPPLPAVEVVDLP